jgi:hypothetical protein
MYLEQEGFQYVMLGRLTQDALENLFSVIRSRRSVPDAREYRSVLRLVCLSHLNAALSMVVMEFRTIHILFVTVNLQGLYK